MIQVTVNGAAHRFERPVDVSALLAALELAGKKVAVGEHRARVRAARHDLAVALDGDRLEIVVAVGGG